MRRHINAKRCENSAPHLAACPLLSAKQLPQDTHETQRLMALTTEQRLSPPHATGLNEDMNDPRSAQPSDHSARPAIGLPSDAHFDANTTAPASVPAQTEQAKQGKQKAVQGSIAGGTWVALIIGALLLILLLVFVLQNQEAVDITFLAWHFSFPTGVGFLLAAIAGALIMAMVGAIRMFQLRRQITKNKK